MHIRFQFFVIPAVLAMAQVLMAPAALAATPGPANAADTAAQQGSAAFDRSALSKLSPSQMDAIRGAGRAILHTRKENTLPNVQLPRGEIIRLREAIDQALSVDALAESPQPTSARIETATPAPEENQGKTRESANQADTKQRLRGAVKLNEPVAPGSRTNALSEQEVVITTVKREILEAVEPAEQNTPAKLREIRKRLTPKTLREVAAHEDTDSPQPTFRTIVRHR